MNTITITLTEQQLESLHMALDMSYMEVLNRLQTVEKGSIRMNVLANQRQHFSELTSIVLKEMDKLNKDNI